MSIISETEPPKERMVGEPGHDWISCLSIIVGHEIDGIS